MSFGTKVSVDGIYMSELVPFIYISLGDIMDVEEEGMSRETIDTTGNSQRAQDVFIPHPNTHFF